MAPKINAYRKTNRDNKPIRPVIENTQAPSYKTAKYLNNRFKNYIDLPYAYTTKKSYEITQELNGIQIKEHHKIITLDIKELYVNLPTENILHITKCWLNRHSRNNTITEQILHLLKVILKQNFFQYNDHFFQPNKGIAMESPISSTLA
jgi:hypothetical protein